MQQSTEEMWLTAQTQSMLRQKQSLLNFNIGGKYLVMEKIYGSLNGEIYKAKHSSTGKAEVYAVYLIFVERVDGARMKQLRDKIRKLRELHHENILPIYESYRSEEYQIIITRCFQEGTLADQIIKCQALELSHAIEILDQISVGLVKIHERYILHEDLNAQSIFINNFKYIIGDFGLRKLMDPQEDGERRGGQISQAPQLFEKSFNYKADIYSLGMILFAMLYPKGSLLERYEKANFMRDLGNMQFVMKNGIKVPLDVQQFLKKTLARSPEDRPIWDKLQTLSLFRNNLYIPQCGIKDQVQTILGVSVASIRNNIIKKKSSQIYQYISQIEQQAQLPEAKFSILSNQQITIARSSYDQKYLNTKKSITRQSILRIYLKLGLYILEQVVTKIQQDKLLVLGEKSNIQIMYLLSYRAYWYFSKVYSQIKRWEVDNLEQMTVYGLFHRAKAKFDYYSRKLTEMENRWSSIFMSSISKLYYSDTQKDKIFNGIEGLDFTTAEHIEYTQSVLNGVKNLQSQDTNKNIRMLSILKAFSQINKLSYMESFGISFEDVVEMKRNEK